jgi:NTP pyrophosphatase (non-canonical NTP hydrolase)
MKAIRRRRRASARSAATIRTTTAMRPSKSCYWLASPFNLNDYAALVHRSNRKWWISLEDGHTRLERNKGELLMLMVSEIAEAMEGERKNLMDDKLPHRRMAEVELADTLIRIFDYAGAFGYDLEGAYREKMLYNQTREDHKHEARALAGGKKW